MRVKCLSFCCSQMRSIEYKRQSYSVGSQMITYISSAEWISSPLTAFITYPSQINIGIESHFRYFCSSIGLVSDLPVPHEHHGCLRVFQMALEAYFQAIESQYGCFSIHVEICPWGQHFSGPCLHEILVLRLVNHRDRHFQTIQSYSPFLLSICPFLLLSHLVEAS